MELADVSAITSALTEALPYVSHYSGKTVVVKIGGSTLGSNDTTLSDAVTLQKLGIRVVIVHGGGSAISQWLRKIGKEPKFVNGLRVTDEETMELVVMTLAGKVNKDLVSEIQRLGGKALGLCGLDAGLMRGARKSEALGLVGLVTSVDRVLLKSLIDSGYIPVIAPIAAGPDWEPLNLNADTAAAEVAVALAAEKLMFLTDVPGVKGANGELLAQLSIGDARKLIASGVISGGMIPKAEACLRALDTVKRSHIIDGRTEHALIRELFTDQGVGTMIVGG